MSNKLPKVLHDAVVQGVYIELGIAHPNLVAEAKKNMPPEEFRKWARKFRKLWRKVAKKTRGLHLRDRAAMSTEQAARHEVFKKRACKIRRRVVEFHIVSPKIQEALQKVKKELDME